MRFDSESDRWTIINALNRAAMQDRATAQQLREGEPDEPEAQNLAAQFERQAKDADRIAEQIEQAED